MPSPHLLAIDNGTQSVRALLFDLYGRLTDKAQIPIQAYTSPHPGWAEQHPDYFWRKVREACQLLWAKTAVPKSSIQGVAITTQRATVINVDAHGRPLRPAILWLDQRQAQPEGRLTGTAGSLWSVAFKAVGMKETIDYFRTQAEANWIHQHQPDIWANTHKYLLLSGYLNYKLCGRFVDSIGSQVAYIPFDYKNLRWATSWDWKWQALPHITPQMLPELHPPTAVLGHITPQAADETGIPVGLPLIAAAADKACEVIGAGARQPHTACLSFGTTATVNITHQKYTEITPLIPPYPAALPHSYSLEVQIFRGFWMVSWFLQEFGLLEQQQAANTPHTAEALLDQLAQTVPPGSMGLMLQPYWSPGLKDPGPSAKGAIIGFGDVHRREHIYRAILEGLAYALREGAERIQKRTHIPITELRVAGGGAQSDVAVQIAADVFGLPIMRPHVYETSGLGAAIDTAVGLNLHPDIDTAVAEMTHTGEQIDPIPAHHDIYEQLYQRIYTKIYPQLRTLYQDLRDITGYP